MNTTSCITVSDNQLPEETTETVEHLTVIKIY